MIPQESLALAVVAAVLLTGCQQPPVTASPGDQLRVTYVADGDCEAQQIRPNQMQGRLAIHQRHKTPPFNALPFPTHQQTRLLAPPVTDPHMRGKFDSHAANSTDLSLLAACPSSPYE